MNFTNIQPAVRGIIRQLSLYTIIAFTAVLFSGTVLAQGTTSSLRVIVADQAGDAVSAVSVDITHVPTDRTITTSSGVTGIATARSLAVGGPYSVSVSGSSDYQDTTVSDIYLELGQTEVVSLSVTRISAGVTEEVVVMGTATTQELSVGVGRDFSQSTIEGIPSLGRDFVSTLAVDPMILVDNSVARGPAVAIAGQNYRYNSVTIDGVAQNDNFGLSKNASATERTPISIDAIEALQVNVAPYDVTYGGFIGGNINIVTKSGTNEFHGGAFAFYTDDSWTGNESDGQNLGIGDFDEQTYGFTLGGPIIKDDLFFFVNYEKFETTRPTNSQPIDAIVGVTQADVDEAIDIFKTVYGFDPGLFAATDTDEDEKTLIKLDWNINDNHRAVASYQKAEGDVAFDDFRDAATLQSSRYNINVKMDSYSFQLFSNWTDNISTEFKYGSKTVVNRQVSFDSSTPFFNVYLPAGGTINAGGDQFRHNNELDNDSQIFRFKLDYVKGDHIISAGFESEEKDAVNTFVPFTRGAYEYFGGLDALRNRELGDVVYGNSTSGVVADAKGVFTLTTNTLFLQDEWSPSDELTLKFGIRYDENDNSSPIVRNDAFAARNGFDNTFNLDGNDLLMPRFGFDWTLSDRLTIRGGAGLFGGGEPLIMLSNSYAGNGVTRNVVCVACFGPQFGPPFVIPELAARAPDPDAAFDILQPFNGVNPDAAVEALHPDFETLSTWKYSLGVDYTADLSGWGMGDGWDLSAEVIFSDVKDGFNVYEGRRSVAGTAPDGRPIYDFPADGDYIVTNTSQGKGTVFSFNLAKSFDTRHGRFDTTFGYTRQDVEEIRSYNRFITYESFAFDATTDFNNMGPSASKYEVPTRVTATASWANEWFGDNTTRISLVYQGRSGRHFSHVMGSFFQLSFGGTFLADFGSEGVNPGSQLFYVPTGVDDPIVTGDPAFLADLNAFIDGEKCLSGARGKIVERNGCRTSFTNIVSLRFLQEINVGNDKKLELTLDIENLGNLLNDDWGRIDSYGAPSNVPVAFVELPFGGSQYIYTPTPAYGGSASTIVAPPQVALLPSVYRIQFGVHFRF